MVALTHLCREYIMFWQSRLAECVMEGLIKGVLIVLGEPQKVFSSPPEMKNCTEVYMPNKRQHISLYFYINI